MFESGLGGPQSRSDSCGEHKKPLFLQGIEPCIIQPVAQSPHLLCYHGLFNFYGLRNLTYWKFFVWCKVIHVWIPWQWNYVWYLEFPWTTFAAEDRKQLFCPFVGTEYSDTKLRLLRNVDEQRQGNIKCQKVYMLKCCVFSSTLTVVCSYLFHNCKYLLI